MPEERPVRRACRWLGLLALAGLIALGLLYVFRGELVSPLLARALAAQAQARLGGRVTLAGVGGTYFTSLELVGLDAELPETSPLRRLRWKTVWVTYSPLELLSGLEAFLRELRVELEGVQVDLVVGEGSPGPPPSPGEAPAPLALPPFLPRLTLHDAEVSVAGPGYRAHLAGLRAETRPEGDATAWQLSLARTELEHPRLQTAPFSAEAQGSYSPASLTVERLLLGGESLVEQLVLDLKGLPEGRLGWEAALTLLDGRLETSGSFRPALLEGRFALTGLRAGELHRFLVLPPFQGTLSGQGSVHLQPEHIAAGEGELTLEVEDARLGDRPVETLRLEASAGEGSLRVAALEAVQGENRISLSGVSLPASALLEGDWRELLASGRGEFRLGLPRLAAALEWAGLRPPEGRESLWPEAVSAEGRLVDQTLILSHLEARSPGGDLEVRSARLGLTPEEAAGAPGLVSGALRVDALEARVGESRLSASGLSLPAEAALSGEWQRVLQRGAGSFDLGVPAPRELLRSLGVSPPDLPEGLWPDRLDLAGRLGEGAASLTRAQLDAPWGTVAVTAARLELPAPGEDLGGAALTLEGRLEVGDLGPLTAAAGLAGARGRVQGRVSAEGTLGAPRFAADLTGGELAYREIPLGKWELRAEGDPEEVEVAHLLLQGADHRLQGSGVLFPARREVSNLRLEVDANDLGAFSPLAPVALAGQLQAHLEASGPLLTPDAALRVTVENLEVDGLPVSRGTVELVADGREVEIRALTATAPVGRLSLGGTLLRGPADRSAALTLESLELERQGLSARLTQPARLTYQEGTLAVEGLALASPAGSLRLEGTLDPQGAVDLTLKVDHLQSEGWLEDLAGDRVAFRGGSLTAELEGTWERPRAHLTGSLDELRLRDLAEPLSGRFELAYSAEGITVSEFRWSGGQGLTLQAEGRLPWDPRAADPLRPGDLDLTARVELPRLGVLGAFLPPETLPSGSAEAHLRLAGSWQAPRGELELRGQDLGFPASLGLPAFGPLELQASASLEAETLHLQTLRVDSPRLDLDGSGRWTGFAPSGVLGPQGWPAATGEVSAQLSFRLDDMGWLPREVAAVRRAQGEVHGELRVEGALPRPRVRGTVGVEGGEFRFRGPLPALEAVSGEVAGDLTRVAIRQLGGELGSAPFQVTGAVELQGPEPTADLRLEGQNLLLFRDPDLLVRADVEISVGGPLSRLRVGGTVAVTEGRYTKNVDFLGFLRGGGRPAAGGGLELFRFPDPPLRDAVFDLKITSQNPFRVRNNVARAALRPELRLTGTGDLPVLHGEVYLDATRLSLPAGQLQIDSGVVRLLETDPDRPRLDLVATTRMLGYDITLRVAGPVTEPTVTLSSTPPLPDDELLLLVLTGKPPESQFDQGQGQATGLAVATYLGRGLLTSLFGDGAESGESIADRFELQVGRGVTRKGGETVEAQFRLGEDVLLEGDTLYLRAERDVYDDVNAGLRIVFRFE